MDGTDIWKIIDKLLREPSTRAAGVEQLVARMQGRSDQDALVAELGISESTLRRRLRDYPEIQEALVRANHRPGHWVSLPDGRTERVTKVLRERGVNRSTFYWRKQTKDVSDVDAISMPVPHRAGPIEWNGESLLPAQWAKRTSIPLSTICSRRQRGWAPAEILSPSGRST